MNKTKLMNLWKTISNFQKPHGLAFMTLLGFLFYFVLNSLLYPKPVYLDFVTHSLKESKKMSIVLNEITTYSRDYFVTVDNTTYSWKLYLRDTDEAEKALAAYNVKLSKEPISPLERMQLTKFLDCLFYFLCTALVFTVFKVYRHVEAQSRNLLLEKPLVKFKDVAGINHILDEVKEAVAHFQNSSKLVAMGGQVLKGIMFHGLPGTGKTLMAKAIAGELKCNFIAVSGSQFIEMYVGLGPKRIRELFDTARKNVPCIIFIDEIDSFAKKRGTTGGSVGTEYDSTVNEMLAQMDGFKDNTGVLVIAATNSLDSIDDALLRAGRFSRKIKVDLPNVEGRREILKLYTESNKKMENIDTEALSKQTTGFSGADLKNLVDIAISEAVRENSENVQMKHFIEAKSKLQLGAVSNIKLSEEDKKFTAYHEVGHALVSKILKGPRVEHISILPRGQSLGQTFFNREEKYSYSKEDLLKQIKIAMGGRVAEKMTTNTESTGATEDLKQAMHYARALVCRFGMSEAGPLNVDFGSAEYMSLSEKTKQQFDEETFKILKQSEIEVEQMLKENEDVVTRWANVLLEKEQIDSNEFYAI